MAPAGRAVQKLELRFGEANGPLALKVDACELRTV
jgi:hypothetical protein